MFLQNLSKYNFDVSGVTISQNSTVSGGSKYQTGETVIGNLGFFSANTCNTIKFGNSSAASSASSNTML